jgi:hypothetical protein
MPNVQPAANRSSEETDQETDPFGSMPVWYVVVRAVVSAPIEAARDAVYLAAWPLIRRLRR